MAYLDYYRETALRKIDALSDAELRSSRVPSGWTPLEAVRHLAYMERRWIQWGFAGQQVLEPWGDDDPATGRWKVADDELAENVIAGLRTVGERTRVLIGDAQLTDLAHVGGRFSGDREPPTLGWILLHVLQEYARHVGHLDIVRELVDGEVGE